MRIVKILLLVLHILTGVLLTLLLAGLFRQSSKDRYFNQARKWWLGRVCRLLSIQITVTGKPADTTVLYVANHISWLDIPILASVVNPVFLSKAEIRDWPLIGWLADKAGTLFIHRGNRDSALAVNQMMQESLSRGKQQPGAESRYSILFFPEGTTSEGTDLLRFRPRLFAAAIDSNVPVQPVLLYYPDKLNKINTSIDPAIPFTGEQTIVESSWKILGQRNIHAQVHFLEPVDSAGKSSKTLAQECERLLRNTLHELYSPAPSITQYQTAE